MNQEKSRPRESTGWDVFDSIRTNEESGIKSQTQESLAYLCHIERLQVAYRCYPAAQRLLRAAKLSLTPAILVLDPV